MAEIQWLEPWWPVGEWNDEQRETYARQLRREVGPEHPLWEVPARFVGKHGGCDDALFELLDGTGRYANVHLTWARSMERMPWPITDIYDSITEFAETTMKEDHEDFTCEDGGWST